MLQIVNVITNIYVRVKNSISPNKQSSTSTENREEPTETDAEKAAQISQSLKKVNDSIMYNHI